jgi:hypothetical protein
VGAPGGRQGVGEHPPPDAAARTPPGGGQAAGFAGEPAGGGAATRDGTPAAGRPRRAEPPAGSGGLAPPPPGATRLLLELHAFASAPQHRWLDAERLGRRVERLGKPDAAAARLVADWLAALAAARPAHADGEQWTVKLDLLRSAALALAPLPATWQLTGPPASGRVPALHFADLHASQLDRLGDLGQEALAAVLEQSLACVPNAAARRVRAMIDAWRGRTTRRSPPIARLIAEAMARHPASDAVL